MRTARFYDKAAWRRLRKRIIARDNYRCVVCHAFVGAVGAARVDHIQTVTAAPSRALDPANLRTLCASCDNKGHSERATKNRAGRIEKFARGSDEKGYPLGGWK
jgi:5-methylcytosine-specific restriction protein A